MSNGIPELKLMKGKQLLFSLGKRVLFILFYAIVNIFTESDGRCSFGVLLNAWGGFKWGIFYVSKMIIFTL